MSMVSVLVVMGGGGGGDWAGRGYIWRGTYGGVPTCYGGVGYCRRLTTMLPRFALDIE
jgi:hypothetical protein